MNGEWFYGRGSDITGPVSGQQLTDLAAGGQIIPTDTIWRDDVEQGVQAASVKNLFHAAVSGPVEIVTAPTLSLSDDLGPVGLISLTDNPPVSVVAPEGVAAPSAEAPIETYGVLPKPAAKLGRATAGKGALILGQDGKTVKFKGKCTTCGREDSSWKSIAIPRGTARASFFCAKCRKRRDVEIFGIV